MSKRNYYSIGEVSKIMGVSVQTLRYYNTIDLLQPAFINKETGYRYYTADQFHMIDRIKYLQKLGMSLSDIRNVLVENDIDALLNYLEDARKDCVDKISALTETLDNIEWYQKYFQYYNVDPDRSESLFSVKHYPERYLVAVKIMEGEEKIDFHVRLTERRNNPPLDQLPYMRQYAYILDYDKLLQNQVKPYYLGMFIKRRPDFDDDHILVIPEGDYCTFTAQILGNQWSSYMVNMYFYDSAVKPNLVVASEYENNLHEYSGCPYEVQVLIPEEADR